MKKWELFMWLWKLVKILLGAESLLIIYVIIIHPWISGFALRYDTEMLLGIILFFDLPILAGIVLLNYAVWQI